MDEGVHNVRSALAVLCQIAIALTVLAYWLYRTDERPSRLMLKWLISAVLGVAIYVAARFMPLLLPLVAVIVGIVFSCLWTPNLATWVASPLTNLFDGGNEELEARPDYTKARTDLRNGGAQLAVIRIHEQLEKFPEDYEGTILLAQILATRFHDVLGANELIERVMNTAKHSDEDRAKALLLLAEWHRKISENELAARVVYERVIRMFPGTVVEQTARRRWERLLRRTVIEPMRITPLRDTNQNDALKTAQRIKVQKARYADVSDARDESTS